MTTPKMMLTKKGDCIELFLYHGDINGEYSVILASHFYIDGEDSVKNLELFRVLAELRDIWKKLFLDTPFTDLDVLKKGVKE